MNNYNNQRIQSMTSKRRIITLALAILVILIVNVSETSNLSYYRSNFKSSVNSHWNNSKSVGRINNTDCKLPVSDIPVVVKYQNETIGDCMESNPMIIDISDIKLRGLGTPLYKSSNINFSAKIQHNFQFETDSVIIKYNINGELTLFGEYSIFGLCSRKKAKTVIEEGIINKLMQATYQNIKSEMQKLNNNESIN